MERRFADGSNSIKKTRFGSEPMRRTEPGKCAAVSQAVTPLF